MPSRRWPTLDTAPLAANADTTEDRQPRLLPMAPTETPMISSAPPQVEMFGLDQCDTCKKARQWLATAGIACRFSDYRKQPIAGEQLKAWGAELGWDVLVNRSGTTWRNLLPQRKHPGTAAEYVLLVRENPSLLRRPILLVDGKVTLGFSHGLYEKLFG